MALRGGDLWMAKRGRPVKEDARRGQYRLRMSEEEEAMLDYIQEQTGKSKAEIFREGLRRVYILTRHR